MAWEIEYTDEFSDWWDRLSDKEQNDIVAVVNLLAEKGANLSFPFSSGITAVFTTGRYKVGAIHELPLRGGCTRWKRKVL